MRELILINISCCQLRDAVRDGIICYFGLKSNILNVKLNCDYGFKNARVRLLLEICSIFSSVLLFDGEDIRLFNS